MSQRALVSFVLTVVLTLALTLPALAADAEVTGYRADVLADLEGLQKKIVGLAEAIPADKYDWRPAEGVRSVSEALMHTAGGHFFFATRLFKLPPPEGIDMANLEKVTDKAKVIEILNQSFATAQEIVKKTPDEKLTETFNMFGRDATWAAGLMAVNSHCHEHLGQLIAYARSMGVTPPWSQ